LPGDVPSAYLGARLDIRAVRTKTVLLLSGVARAAFPVYFFTNQMIIEI